MVVGPNSKAHTQSITALVPLLATKHEQFESGYSSTNSASDESLKYERVYTAKSRKSCQQTPNVTVKINRPKSVLYGTHQRDSIERNSTKQQQHQRLNRDPIKNYHRLKTATPRISIDTTPFEKIVQNQKIIKVLHHYIFYIRNVNYYL
jgi:hypothetical protein